MSTLKNQLAEVLVAGNWNSVKGFCTRNKITFKVVTAEFGLQGSKKAEAKKAAWITEQNESANVFAAHRYAVGIKSKSGFHYNRIFAQAIIF